MTQPVLPGGELGGSTQGTLGWGLEGAGLLADTPLSSAPDALVLLAGVATRHLQRQQVWGLSPASLPGGIVARRLQV